MNRCAHHQRCSSKNDRFVWLLKWQLTFLQSTERTWCLRAKLLNAIIITFVGNVKQKSPTFFFTRKIFAPKMDKKLIVWRNCEKCEEEKKQIHWKCDGKKCIFEILQKGDCTTSAFSPLNGLKSNKYCRPLIGPMRSINVRTLFYCCCFEMLKIWIETF